MRGELITSILADGFAGFDDVREAVEMFAYIARRPVVFFDGAVSVARSPVSGRVYIRVIDGPLARRRSSVAGLN